jgi:hypothetical protein
MRACVIHRLLEGRCIAVEAIVALDGRLVTGIVGSVVVPYSTVFSKAIMLESVFLIHVQLARIVRWKSGEVFQ